MLEIDWHRWHWFESGSKKIKMDTLRKRIGGVDIAEYVFEPKPSDQTPEKISQLTQKIEEMGGPKGTNAFPYERKALERLCLEKAFLEYPVLNLSFLDMVQTIDNEENEKVTVPRFVVFPIDSTGKVTIYLNDDKLYYNFGNDSALHEDVSIFSKHVYNGMKDYLKNRNNIIKFKCNIGDIILHSETRKRIKLAESTFCRENLYMISEAKPSNLTVNPDPLVVGVTIDQCFLIDKFDPTPIEDYVSREFVK
ncbi:hypothetical protein JW851_03180 [Candidatus Woesearchaeota archaeon]|nr:hypothetical protein [Candidatus Woesearchaeota archaeon]